MTPATLLKISSLPLLPNTYIYKLLSLPTRLALISSDDTLRTIDPATLQVIITTSSSILPTPIHEGMTCLETSGGSHHDPIVFTAGKDAVVRCWDLRTGERGIEYRDDGNAAYLSLSCNDNGPVVGTEHVNSQASVIIWDNRAPQSPIRQYTESHNDDITVVQHHPTNPHHLLSGSTDGLVNIYDTTLSDEDEALIQVANHGSSINRAGFLSEDRFFALSHDENFSIYRVEGDDDGDDGESVGQSPIVFGDLRPKLEWAGSHSEYRLDLVPLRMIGERVWDFDLGNVVRLPGAHGEDIVRYICFDKAAQVIFTAGEDGKVRAWRSPDGDEAEVQEGEHEKQRKKKKDLTEKGSAKGRFKPY